ncbi:MAG: hypothetical protein HYT37_01955 [Candidatus Sungbacteria bacterium]|nr:hypothetical protein [Candidatus Sungbacteria bacterium]
MKTFFILISIACAFLIESALARILPVITFAPPLTLLTVFYWLWHGEKKDYLAIIASAGFFLESVSLFFPGSYVVVLLTLSFFTPVLKRYAANQGSLRVQTAVFALFLFFTATIMDLYMFFAGKIYGLDIPVGWRRTELFMWMAVWPLVYVLFLNFILRPIAVTWPFSFMRY